MDSSQYIYMIVLLVGSVVAVFGGSRFLVMVMWANFMATMAFSFNPVYLMIIDLMSAVTILAVLGTKQAKTIAFIFCVMVFIYPLSKVIGKDAIFTTVDGLAYVQIFALGSTGFGRGLRYYLNRLRRLSYSYVSGQKDELDTTENGHVALGKGVGP